MDTKKHFGLDEPTEEEQKMLDELYKEYEKPLSYVASLIIQNLYESIEQQKEPAKVLKVVTDAFMFAFSVGYRKAIDKKESN